MKKTVGKSSADACKAVGEWCKEHWIMVVTVLVVIAIAVVAVVTFGVAIAAIAAIAGIVALVLCAADVICILATGGKSISDLCRENGMGWLGEIFDGISIGCDIVSIVFPAGAAIKTMAKVGVKSFVKGSIQAAKLAFKDTVEKVFKSGFKNGVKNLGKIAFKTFIFDIDDFTKIKNGKRIFDIMEMQLDPLLTNNHWIKIQNDLWPELDYTPKPGRNGTRNLKGQTLDKILSDYTIDSLPITSIPLTKSGDIDWNALSVIDPVKISMKNLDIDIDQFLSGNMDAKQMKEFNKLLRDINYSKAQAKLPEGITLSSLEKDRGFPINIHEDLSTKKCYFVATEIHSNINHNGGIANYKFNLKGIADKFSDLFGKSGFGIVRFAYDVLK